MSACPLTTRPGQVIGWINGRPVHAIAGGSAPLPGPGPAPGPDPAPAPPPAPAPTPPPTPPAPAADPEPTGFPANTPLEQMTSDQREAYWKHQARKHEDRNKALGSLTPEQLADLQTKAARAEELERELMSDTERQVEEAKAAARAEAIAEATPEVITFALDAAAARADVSEEDLKAAVEFVDVKKFLKADGKVDADKVKTFVGSIKPDRGAPGQPPRGPSPAGQGRRPSSQTGSAQEKGHAEAVRRGYVKADA